VVSESVLDGPAWADHARRVEEAGIGSLLIRDHFSADAFGQQLDDKLAVLRSAAGDRFGQLELSVFGTFSITDRRRASTEELIVRRGWGGTDAEDVWQMPAIFIGSVAQIREDLQARRERFGLSYLVTSDHELPTLAAIIAGS
jgi:alkanesulfonate monooxygenase SsuD/methylene tetrahydromethanopterin reductase-like flavin-dependent oxidoreductase (luciferase family)